MLNGVGDSYSLRDKIIDHFTKYNDNPKGENIILFEP